MNKYRIWDKKLERWNDSIIVGQDERFYDKHDAEIPYKTNLDRFVIQQFSGFKDKNGKEIFEGDVLYYNDGSDDDEGVAIFKNGMFKVEWRHDTYGENHNLNAVCQRGEGVEIIRNIYSK